MAVFDILVAFGARLLLVLLFLPFSALDKILNFSGARAQASETGAGPGLATALVLLGLAVELFMSLAILIGVADRAAACVLAGYCCVTALLWKQFWVPGDFWASATGKGRTLFWDFLKNFALAGGFLILALGTNSSAVHRFFEHPFASSHPYRLPNR